MVIWLDLPRFRRHISNSSYRTFVTVGTWPKAVVRSFLKSPNFLWVITRISKAGGQEFPDQMVSYTGIFIQSQMPRVQANATASLRIFCHVSLRGTPLSTSISATAAESTLNGASSSKARNCAMCWGGIVPVTTRDVMSRAVSARCN